MIKIAFDAVKRMILQSVAFDFIVDKMINRYLIVEMCYAFGFDKEEKEHGYWDENLNRHEEVFNPFGWMVENMNQ